MSKMKTSLDKIKGRFDTAEEKISELEHIAIETIQNEQDKKHKKKTFKASGIYGTTSILVA